MLVNADFSQPVVVTPQQYRWVASPQAGVERVMLDRVGGETARATSLVRYAPDSHFPAHTHGGGEEILVLSGTFSDEQGDYPAGWYLRNPPGSVHQPSSRPGTIIFVKLRQMARDEHRSVRIDTRDPARWSTRGSRQVCELFEGFSEHVVVTRLASGQPLFDTPVPGAEILVLQGELQVAQDSYVPGTWLRFPAGSHPYIVGGVQGCTVYLKTGDPGKISWT
jgi:anti-sigma factor ChrR (cupin superfamily)